MEVTNQPYYHLQRINESNINWKIGDKIIFSSKRKNFYYSSLMTSFYDILKENDIPEIEGKKLENNILNGVLIEYSQRLLEKLLGLIRKEQDKNKVIQYFQELIYECVRKEKYNHLPSRNNCIWIVPKLEDLNEWKDILPSLRSRILKLNLKGEIHETTGLLICTDKNRQIKNAFENANKYWRPDFDITKETEYLFEGVVEIDEEILG